MAYGDRQQEGNVIYKKMKKTILIIILIILFIALGIYFWFFINKPNTTNTNSSGQLPSVEVNTPSSTISSTTISSTSVSENIPTGDTMVIGTLKGSVTMNNFYKNAAIVSPGEGALVTENPDYDIVYSSYDSSFSISLLKTPIDTTRLEAENALLKSLGIKKEDACKLKVMVSVPISVDPQYAGVNLGLSFCSSTFQLQ